MKYIFICLLSLLLFSCAKEVSDNPVKTEIEFDTGSFEFGSEAPDFEVRDIDSNVIKLSDYRGKVVFIDFWASWCNICTKAMPEVKSIYKKYKDSEFAMISISLDYQEDAWKQAIMSYDMEWTQVFDQKPPSEQNIASLKYNIPGIPTVAIIDKEGRLRYLSYHNKIQIETVIDMYIDG